MRPPRLPAPGLASAGSILLVAVLVASCGLLARRGTVVVAIDEAFASARPGLASRLQARGLFGQGPYGVIDGATIAPVALSEGAGVAYDAAMAQERRDGAPSVLVASPLIAKAILGSGTWTGDPRLLVPEWREKAPPGLWTATTDPIKAYGEAGEAAGAFVAALAREGGSPSCGVLFSESASRPRQALAAFASAYSLASEGRPIFVRNMGGEPAVKQGAKAQAAQGSAMDSAAASAQATVAELLGSDIRVLFVAIGSASGAAIQAASRAGVAIGADFPAPETPPTLAFRIHPDDRALADRLATLAGAILKRDAAHGSDRLGKVDGISGDPTKMVPARLEAGPSATTIFAGKLDFAHFLSEALRAAAPGSGGSP